MQLKENMSAQEIFDYVVWFLRKQNQKSLDTNGHCSYRGANGLMCAVGCVMKDDEYNPKYEDHSIYRLIDNGYRDVLPKRIVDNKILLADLQRVHDSFIVKDWPEVLWRVARKHNLNFFNETYKEQYV